MNPTVVKYAGQVGFDAAEFTWFDLSLITQKDSDELLEFAKTVGYHEAEWKLQDFPLPCENIAIIPPVESNGKPQFIITYNKELTMGGYTGPAICAWVAEYPDPVPMGVMANAWNEQTNSYVHIREDLMKKFNYDEKLYKAMERTALMFPVTTLVVLNRKALVDEVELNAYRGNNSKPFINRKRMQKNKPPIYDWVTVKLAPSRIRNEHQGGTHASPARHERRGHYRRYPSGKISWVKPTWVGSIERGLIVKDYIPEEKAA